MTCLSRRQFSTVTLLGGLGALAAPRISAAQTGDLPIAQSISVAQPTVSLTVNNTALTFLVDTARPYSSIHPDVASWLGLTPTGEQTIPGIGPTLDAPLYSAPLTSSAGTLPFQFAAVENLSLVSEHANASELQGILGGDFLGQFSDFSVTETSFIGVVASTPTPVPGPDPGPVLDAAARNAALPPPLTITYPVTKIGNDLYVTIEIIDGTGKKVKLRFLLDTGAQASVITNAQAVALRLPPVMIFVPPGVFIPVLVPIGGVGGGVIALVTPVNLPGLGNFQFVSFNFPLGPGVAGILGMDVLGNSFTLQVNGGVGTLTITTPLGQLVEVFLGLYRSILKAFEGRRRIIGVNK
jgi:hypothetical protein